MLSSMNSAPRVAVKVATRNATNDSRNILSSVAISTLVGLATFSLTTDVIKAESAEEKEGEEEVKVVEPVFAVGEVPHLSDAELEAAFDDAIIEAAIPSDLQQESSGEEYEGGAYNPVTGEINWDCPCLGGMAYGPCGEEFKTAFSCFVFSQEEPKGVNCIPLFEYVL